MYFGQPISLFLALWIGALIAFLYLDFPLLGDVGSLSFGATCPRLLLLTWQKLSPSWLYRFIVEGLSSALQILSKTYYTERRVHLCI